MKILTTVKLPCSASELEMALHNAGHAGHWHDAEIRKGDDPDTLVVAYPSEDEK